MRLFAFDPGLKKAGCSTFWNGELEHAWTVHRKKGALHPNGPAAWKEMAEILAGQLPVDVFVTEVMQVYQGKHAADLLELNGVAGAVMMQINAPRNVGYLPREWKGQVPKEVHHRRIKAKLTVEELARVSPDATHDAWDAIGLGLHYLTRSAL